MLSNANANANAKLRNANAKQKFALKKLWIWKISWKFIVTCDLWLVTTKLWHERGSASWKRAALKSVYKKIIISINLTLGIQMMK